MGFYLVSMFFFVLLRLNYKIKKFNTMRRLFSFVVILLLGANLAAQTASNNTVNVVFNGSTATVSVADNITQFITS